MELFDHQKQLLELNPNRYLLSWGTGTAKSRTALELAKKNSRGGFLVITKKDLKAHWRREIEKWGVRGGLIISKEEFRRDWQIIPGFDLVVFDEAHYAAGMTSQITKNFSKYLKKHNPTYRYLLTATPYLRDPWNIYALAKHLGYDWNYASFKNKFFYDVRMGARIVPILRDGMEEEVATLVSKIGSTVKIEDCSDMPEENHETRYVSLTPEQVKAIKKINAEESVHITRWTRIHQITGGHLTGDGYTESQRIKSDKVEVLKDIVAENKKVIVACRYTGELEMLKEELAGYNVMVLNGMIKDKDGAVRAFNEAGEAVLLVNSMVSEGWQAPTCDLVVFYSLSFSLKDTIQMRGRIRRIDHIQKTRYITLVTEGTIDEDVFKCIERKSDFHIAIYNK